MFYKTLVMQSQLDNPISPLDTCTSGLVWSVSSSDHTLRYKKNKKNGYGPVHKLWHGHEFLAAVTDDWYYKEGVGAEGRGYVFIGIINIFLYIPKHCS